MHETLMQKRATSQARSVSQVADKWASLKTFDNYSKNNLDDATRTYLKRLKRSNPHADVALPEGYYDTDEEVEKRERIMLQRKLTSKFVVYKIDEDENAGKTVPFAINKHKTESMKKLTA